MNVNISNHMPIYFQLEGVSNRVAYHFKFNHIWTEVEEFNLMSRNNWVSLNYLVEEYAMHQLTYTLKELKSNIIQWEKKKNLALKEYLINIEYEIHTCFLRNYLGVFSEYERGRLVELEARKTDST